MTGKNSEGKCLLCGFDESEYIVSSHHLPLRTIQNGKFNISALSSLTNLKDLVLSENQISDISALSSLKSLTDLRLFDNQISDISALSGLSKLSDLDISRNPIKDYSPLKSLPKDCSITK